MTGARTVFVSDAIHGERQIFDPPGGEDPGTGTPGGWHALSALYRASLAACGYRVEPVVRPEIYQTGQARAAKGVRPGDWHLAVKPIEHLRPFHGIPNAFVCDWPFPELSAAPPGGSPFLDQVRMLGMADAVLCCTSFTADTLRRAGLDRVVVLPPHIPARALPVAGPGTGRRFVCLADATQQHGPVAEGFRQARAQRDDLHLVVVGEGGPRPVPADAAVTVVDTGAPWLAGADFFLCGDPASGLVVPLVEAMLAGVPVVATRQAGVASILPPDAALPIAAGHGLPPTADAVRDAVLAAAALDQATRSRMASAARNAAERRFGLPAFQAGLDTLAALLTP